MAGRLGLVSVVILLAAAASLGAVAPPPPAPPPVAPPPPVFAPQRFDSGLSLDSLFGENAEQGGYRSWSPTGLGEVITSPQFAAGWNMISFPLPPVDPDSDYPPSLPPGAWPEEVFFVEELDRYLSPEELAVSSLTRYDDALKSYIAYDEFEPETFGVINPRDGYWFHYYLEEPFTLRYEGWPRTGDVDYALDYAGWNIVGYGHTTAQNLGDPAGDGAAGTSVVNNHLGGLVDTFRNAWYTDLWVVGPLQTWDPAVLGYKTVGVDCPPFETDVSIVQPWYGYWFYSVQPNLVWRMPVPPAQLPCAGPVVVELDYPMEDVLEVHGDTLHDYPHGRVLNASDQTPATVAAREEWYVDGVLAATVDHHSSVTSSLEWGASATPGWTDNWANYADYSSHTYEVRVFGWSGALLGTDSATIQTRVPLPGVWVAVTDVDEENQTYTVEGTCGFASAVTVNGNPVTIQPEGDFSAQVPLVTGVNTVTAVATGAGGRTTTTSTSFAYHDVATHSATSPFDPGAGQSTTIEFSLVDPFPVTLRIYDYNHPAEDLQYVVELLAPTEVQPSGQAITAPWDGTADVAYRNVSPSGKVRSGTYLYHITAGPSPAAPEFSCAWGTITVRNSADGPPERVIDFVPGGSDPQVAYTGAWEKMSDLWAERTTLAIDPSPAADDSVVVSFTASPSESAAEIDYVQSPRGGLADVFLDDSLLDSIACYSADGEGVRASCGFNLSPGSHTLRIRYSGPGDGGGKWLFLDCLRVR